MSSISGLTIYSNEEVSILYKTISNIQANALAGKAVKEELASLSTDIQKVAEFADKIVALNVNSRILVNEIVQIADHLKVLSEHYSPIYAESLKTPEIDKVHKSVLPLIYEIASNSDTLKRDLNDFLQNVTACPKIADPVELDILAKDIEKICSTVKDSPKTTPIITELKKCLPQ